MSREQLISDAVGRLCDAAEVTTDKQREELQEVLAKWIDTLPTIEAEHAKDDRLYWVRTPGSGWKRRAFRVGGGECHWRVDGVAGLLTDAEVIVLGEVERDDNTPDHPEVLATVDDFENAPRGTIIAINGYGALTKRSEGWRDLHGFPNTNEGVANRAETATFHVLRWGGSK